MTEDYQLIRQLAQIEKNPDPGPKLPKNIKYQTQEVLVDGENIEVFIPLREVEAFKETLLEHGKYLNRDELTAVLRKHRGIRNWE